MVKYFVNVKDNVPTARNRNRQQNIVTRSSKSDNATPESQSLISPTISSFAIALDDDASGGTSSQRPTGV